MYASTSSYDRQPRPGPYDAQHSPSSTYGGPTSYSVAPQYDRYDYRHDSVMRHQQPQQQPPHGDAGLASSGSVVRYVHHDVQRHHDDDAAYRSFSVASPSNIGQTATFSVPLLRASVVTDDGALFEFGSVALYCEPYRVVAAVPHATMQLAPVWAEDYPNITYLGVDDRRVMISAGPSQIRGLAPDAALAAGLASHVASMRRQNQDLERSPAQRPPPSRNLLFDSPSGHAAQPQQTPYHHQQRPEDHQQRQLFAASSATSPPQADFGVQCGRSVTERLAAAVAGGHSPARQADASEPAAAPLRKEDSTASTKPVPPKKAPPKGPPPSPPAKDGGTGKAKAPPANVKPPPKSGPPVAGAASSPSNSGAANGGGSSASPASPAAKGPAAGTKPAAGPPKRVVAPGAAKKPPAGAKPPPKPKPQ